MFFRANTREVNLVYDIKSPVNRSGTVRITAATSNTGRLQFGECTRTHTEYRLRNDFVFIPKESGSNK